MPEEEEQNGFFETEPLDKKEDAILQISKWTRMIALIGFSIGAFIVVVMLISGAQILQQFAEALPIKAEGTYGALVAVFFILFFAAALVLYYLHKASQLLLHGVQQKNGGLIAQGFGYLKKFFIAVTVLGAFQLFTNLSSLL